MLSFSDLALAGLIFCLILLIYPEVAHARQLRQMWVLVIGCYLPVMLLFNNFHRQRAIIMDHVVSKAFQAVGVHALFLLSLSMFLGIGSIPIYGYITFYGMMIIALPLWWMISRWIIKSLRRHGYNFSRVVIVGTGSTAMRLFEELHSDAGFGYRVMGFFDDSVPDGFKGKYVGKIKDLDGYVKANSVDEIFYTLSGENEQALSTTIKIADDNVVQFYYVPQISRMICRNFEMCGVGAVPMLSIRRNPLKSVVNRCMKRTFDILFSSLFLIVSPVIFIPVAIAIKRSSPGPVFFKQERTGYKGRSFKCWKFRTMRVNAESDRQQATKDDPRKTRVGDFLRRTSIDELPQFINVWLGDMSVVGPRPHMIKHTHEYSRIIDMYMVRHTVQPGITGLAQVNGYRGLTDELWKMEKRVEYDVWYIENWSFLLDMKIIVRTVINAFHGEKNAF